MTLKRYIDRVYLMHKNDKNSETKPNTIQADDLVLIVYDTKRRWLVNLKKNDEFHTNKGIINCQELIGKEYGIKVESSLGERFLILKPSIRDLSLKVKRCTQVIYPKDASMIIYYTGISSGYRVVEAGVGSGALTVSLAHYVKPNGKIYGYEVSERQYKVAKENIVKYNLEEMVDLKLKDINEDIEVRDVDVVILDLADPWNTIPHISERNILKNGGYLATFSPTTSQVEKTLESLKTSGFYYIKTMELLCRTWQPYYGKFRPYTRMVGHTGFLTFAVRISDI
ncbi:MAG: methyltransferase domain-containing protein [Candidatus Lokiarchaeota archaeon]|nr:methyltransferase domain-containing protein [Candidatus Lokiarchaeota archaeon]